MKTKGKDMYVYRFFYKKESDNLCLALYLVSEKQYKLVTEFEIETFIKNVNFDTSYMVKQYGFELSVVEKRLFLMHLFVVDHFCSLNLNYCLVLESGVLTNPSKNALEEVVNKIPSDWDIFFPFDGEKRKVDDFLHPNVLGYRWGADAYFLSNKGANKINSLIGFRQPFDDEVIELSLQGKINLYYEDVSLFQFPDKCEIKEYLSGTRDRSIFKSIMERSLWPDDSKEKIISIVSKISRVINTHDFNVLLSDGTLLGCIRHGKIMPWDDDFDLAINEAEIDVFLEALSRDTDLQFCTFYWRGHLSYKIWHNDGKQIDNRKYKFPFVDVWLFKEVDEKIIFNYGVEYPSHFFYPSKEVFFEGYKFKIPGKAISCLDLMYKNWKECIEVFEWRHCEERASNFPLRAKITVDLNGRMVI